MLLDLTQSDIAVLAALAPDGELKDKLIAASSAEVTPTSHLEAIALHFVSEVNRLKAGA